MLRIYKTLTLFFYPLLIFIIYLRKLFKKENGESFRGKLFPSKFLINKDGYYSTSAQSVAYQNLRNIQAWMVLSGGGDASSRRHRQYVKDSLRYALEP